ncbi:hypothetical protein Ddc_04304 [Ditylenchus destructor]|nr:hypothetical protein Ddc_04304 [Ditylenchus destructor]
MKSLNFSLTKFVGFHQKTVILLLWTSQILRHVSGLVCYSCTSSLDHTIETSAQIALRIFLDSTYKLPPANRLCNMEDDVEFKTVPTAQCSITNDACVKVSAKNQGKSFNFAYPS